MHRNWKRLHRIWTFLKEYSSLFGTGIEFGICLEIGHKSSEFLDLKHFCIRFAISISILPLHIWLWLSNNLHEKRKQTLKTHIYWRVLLDFATAADWVSRFCTFNIARSSFTRVQGFFSEIKNVSQQIRIKIPFVNFIHRFLRKNEFAGLKIAIKIAHYAVMDFPMSRRLKNVKKSNLVLQLSQGQ